MIQLTAQSTLVLLASFCAITLIITMLVVKGRAKVEFRKIAGFEAIPEAIGRAAEMGRPIFCPGGYSGGVASPERAGGWLASLTVLGYIAELACKYNVHMIAMTPQPDSHIITTEIIRAKYIQMGRSPSLVDTRYTTREQFAYTSAVVGVIQREKIGASFPIGTWGGEALIITESAAAVGAIQVGAEGSTVMQIPSMLAACDYMIIGEELFAAAASVSKNPEELAGLHSQSIMKIIIMIIIIAGSVLASFGDKTLATLLSR